MDGLHRSVRQTTRPDRLGEWLEQSAKQTHKVILTKGKSLDTLDYAEVLTLPPSLPLSRSESWSMLAIDLESLGDSSSRVSGSTCRSSGSTSSWLTCRLNCTLLNAWLTWRKRSENLA